MMKKTAQQGAALDGYSAMLHRHQLSWQLERQTQKYNV